CAVAAIGIGGANAEAGQRRGPGRPGSPGTAVERRSAPPRASRPVIVSPRIGVVGYRPYYYRPGFSIGLYAGYPFGYFPYGYGAYSYYPRYGYYGGYGYPYAMGPGYIAATAGVPYGGVRIEGAPRDAQVFVDGYYAGIVDDFDGAFQRLTLTAGPHSVEIRMPGSPPVAVDLLIEPGQ